MAIKCVEQLNKLHRLSFYDKDQLTEPGLTYLACNDVEIRHAYNHVEPNDVKDLEDTQQTIVCIIYRSHSSDGCSLKQSTSQDPKYAKMKKIKHLEDPIRTLTIDA